MKKIKINSYSELEKLKEFKREEFIVDLKECSLNQRKRVIDFLSGIAFSSGSIVKLNNNEFEIKY